MTRKIMLSVLVLALGIAIPVAASAAIIRANEQVTLSANEAIPDDTYAAGGTIQSGANVQGDFVAAGGTIVITGSTTEDVMAAGGSIMSIGAVGDDLRAAGGSVTISGPVADDAIVAGGQVTLSQGATVGGDLLTAGGQVRIDGVVNGNVDVGAGELVIGNSAVIRGGLTYRSSVEAKIESGAVIAGPVDFKQIEGRPQDRFDGMGAIARFLMLFASALVIQWLFRVWAERLAESSRARPLVNFGWGILALIAIPIIAILGFITVIGIPLAFILLLAYVLTLIFSYLFIPIFAGALTMKYFRKSERLELDWKTALVGALIIAVLSIIPVIGGLVNFILMLIVLGAIVRLARDSFRESK